MMENLLKKQQEIVNKIEELFGKEAWELTAKERKDPRFIELDKEYDRLEMLIQTECF